VLYNKFLTLFRLFGGAALALTLGAVPAQAGLFVFVTPPGSSTGGGPVSAEADLTVNPGSISITLKNLQANPTDVAQLLSDLSFTVSVGNLTGSTHTGASAQEITVNGNGTFTLGANLTTPAAVGWVYSSTATTGTLDVLAAGGAGPAHLIIGPPGGGGTYSNANGSIAGNGPHNPFLNQSAMFTITAPGVSTDTRITAVTFSFGTVSGVNIPGVMVPEPSSACLAIVGAAGLGLARRRRLRAAHRAA
jgi:hypothetical protein